MANSVLHYGFGEWLECIHSFARKAKDDRRARTHNSWMGAALYPRDLYDFEDVGGLEALRTVFDRLPELEGKRAEDIQLIVRYELGSRYSRRNDSRTREDNSQFIAEAIRMCIILGHRVSGERGCEDLAANEAAMTSADPSTSIELVGKVENSKPTPRRAYRPEIKAYMKTHDLGTNEMAARRLGVGLDTLKSIMSGKGNPRFSQETLEEVLKKIGFQRP